MSASRASISLLWEKTPPAGHICQVQGIGKYLISSPEEAGAGWFMLYLQLPSGGIEWLRASQSIEKLKFAAASDVAKRMIEP